ncbi:LysR family transcriptional regulator [Pseudoduganella umbonata]|uniref:DNA-binding transcriptional LysR family regulator n=1 Tax=Pseudoduganella umbonata TaxID=864828 RepID=A0A4P8HL80_9BURK|nr:LysR family transcriptional regulator [Pseudoduganella umbonata]MBB3221211.1 DNA-binding transcriptional LysR family regulator [Pseudoduganella umbonata]QCP10397.1 LysR family transcriptional regulator [Pseudoduganella umbonata]
MNKLLSFPRPSAPLRGADLPLLISLNVLLEECNVTRAAARLHVSQPALSAQLSRLRVLFGDPLLVPAESGRGLAPSPFALKLHRRLQPALAALTTALRPKNEDFEPAHAARTFNVVANSTGAAAVLPGLTRHVQAYGNRQLRLTLSEPEESELACRLERGDVDLCFGAACMLPPGLLSMELMTTPYVLVQRKGHARGCAAVTLDEYASLDHVNVSRDSSLHGALDEQLYRLGHSRHTAMAVRDFSAVGAIVAAGDLVCTVPAFLAASMPPSVDLAELAFPFLSYTLCMAWHPGADDDPGLAWLRAQVLASTQGSPKASAGSRTG